MKCNVKPKKYYAAFFTLEDNKPYTAMPIKSPEADYTVLKINPVAKFADHYSCIELEVTMNKINEFVNSMIEDTVTHLEFNVEEELKNNSTYIITDSEIVFVAANTSKEIQFIAEQLYKYPEDFKTPCIMTV